LSGSGKSLYTAFKRKGFNFLKKTNDILKHYKVLFVTWDGPEVTYVESLFVPIFLELQEGYGYEFHIIQFTSADAIKIEQRKTDLQKMGLRYKGIQINRKFPMLGMLKGKFWDIFTVNRYIKSHQIEVLMPRAVNSLFILKSLVKKSSLKFVFDADGFPMDERVDFSGLSPLGWRNRFFRDVEFSGFHRARSVICRSEKAKEIIICRAGSGFDSQKVMVINNGTATPFTLYQLERKSIPLTLVYAGSLGPQYMLDEMVKTFVMILQVYPEARFKILTFKMEEAIAYIQNKFPNLSQSIEVYFVPSERVVEELEKADIAFSFRKYSFSMQGVAPIKLVEYLRAGLSIVYTPQTGDIDEILEGKPFAFRLDFTQDANSKLFLDWVKEQIEKDFSKEVRSFASERFSLQGTVDMYHRAIQYGNY
jgi:hypothetical protein